MNGNCDLELRLNLPPFPETNHPHPYHHQQQQQHYPSTTHYSQSMVGDVNNGNLEQIENRQEQKLTLVYGGNICVTDVTELQARAILIVASREMEMARARRTEPSSPTLQSHLNLWCNPNSCLSMKRSLKRFLQKRKDRVQDASPY